MFNIDNPYDSGHLDAIHIKGLLTKFDNDEPFNSLDDHLSGGTFWLNQALKAEDKEDYCLGAACRFRSLEHYRYASMY